jgi:hypothetical protein
MSSTNKLNFIADEELRNAIACALQITASKDAPDVAPDDYIDGIIKQAIQDGVLYVPVIDLSTCGFGIGKVNDIVKSDPSVWREGPDVKILVRPMVAIKAPKKSRVIKTRPESIVTTPITPFSYITDASLRTIMTCLFQVKYNKTERSTPYNEYLIRESRAAEEIGYVETTAREWTNCSTLQQLDQYEIMKMLQILEPDVKGGPRRIVIPTKLPKDVVITPKYIGESIRNWLLLNNSGSPAEFWQFVWKRVKPESSYVAVAQYFYTLEQLGLIEKIAKKPYVLFDKEHHGKDAMIFYSIVKGREADPNFRHAKQELHFATIPGGKRYQKAKEKGTIQFGRNPKYL